MADPRSTGVGAGAEGFRREAETNLLIQAAVASILRVSLEPVPMEQLLQRVLDQIFEIPWLSFMSQGCIFLAEQDSKQLVMKAQVGMPEGALGSCGRVPYGVCICGQAIAAEDIIFKSCIDEHHCIRYPGITPHGHYCVPILVAGRHVGLLNLYVREGHVPSPIEDRFLRAAADVLAGIIERKQVEEALRRSEERFELATRGTDAGIVDWDLRTGSVYYSPRSKGMLGYEEAEISDRIEEWEDRLHPGDRERALATIQDCLDGRASEYELEHRVRHKDGSYRWILARGATVCDRQGRPYRMVGWHLDITARKRVEQEHRQREARLIAARKILERLLPRAALQVQGIDICGASYPAEYAQGDYYDFRTLPDGTVLAIVADVCGHGFDAALLMAMTHAWLRSLTKLPFGIDEILERINQELLEQIEDDRFITLMMLCISPGPRTLIYGNAGHPPGYLIGKDGALRATLESLSLPLGVLDEVEFPVGGPVALESGDLILLITDGVLEVHSPAGELFGVERMLQVLRERIDQTNQEILAGLHAAILDFAGPVPLPDDVTMVLIRVN